MFTLVPRTLVRTVVLASMILVGTTAAVAQTPQSTPLYWAAWTKIYDVDGAHSWDESSREHLVRLLLDHGADPNIIAGDGNTALDVARTAGARRIAALLQERGAKSAADL